MTASEKYLPLDGIKVFELGIAIASPFCGKLMAHFGADVIKIESRTSPDVVRLLGSAWLKDREDLASIASDTSPYVSEMNASKRSVGLELKTEQGKAAAMQILAQCDVFIANFGARALADLGFDYESVKAVKPDIVYVQLPGFGSNPDMPYYPFVAWGPNQAPLVGMDDFTGHNDDPPAGIATVAPPDYMSALHAAIATLTGLEQRDLTGQGVHVDISQFETTLALLGPFVMDYDLTGTVPSRIGNRSMWGAPQGVYPCSGSENWIAISATENEDWDALKALAGNAIDDFFDNPDLRVEQQDLLDKQIADWTINYQVDDLADRLQTVGVAAHTVSRNEDLLRDTHVMSRGWYQIAPSKRLGRDVFSNCLVRLDQTPGRWTHAGPSMGQHTREVLQSYAGLSDAQIDGLIEVEAAFESIDPDTTTNRPWDDWIHMFIPGVDDARDL
ncbi:MAG: CaiB/BaiF CoA transferase family protein [Acidimicrobiales bacterium]